MTRLSEQILRQVYFGLIEKFSLSPVDRQSGQYLGGRMRIAGQKDLQGRHSWAGHSWLQEAGQLLAHIGHTVERQARQLSSATKEIWYLNTINLPKVAIFTP
jgi:hypothetical protein